MVIDRSKHNKFVGLPEKTTDTRGTTGASGSGSGDRSTTVIIGGGGGTASLDPELIEELRNQEAFSYINISDGLDTILTAALIEKDYFNLAIQGDGETSETLVSSDKYLPRTLIEATGSIPGSYWVVFNHYQVPDIGTDGEPVYKDVWRIELTKMSPDPAVRPNIDYNGIELIYQGASQGLYNLSDDRVSVLSTDDGDTHTITINQDSYIDFDTLSLVWTQDTNHAPVTTLSGIAILNYVTVTITQAGATRFWKLDEYGNLYTDYNAYSNLDLGAKGRLWTDTGLYVGNFTQGISGGVFYVLNELGDTYIEADRMRIRKKAYFETLEIVNVNSVGGKLIISPAGAITVRKVEEITITLDADTLASLNVPDPTLTKRLVYRCYFMGEQDGVEVENRWHVGDLAFSLNFNIKTPGTYELVANHYFWRLVVGVSTEIDDDGNHYIDLDKVDCDYMSSGGDGLLDSDPPHVNDVVAQLGNKNDVDRQSALIFSSVDAESPRIILCHGINTYTLADTEYFDVGVNHSTNQAYTNIYGRAYIGKKDLSSYLRYDPDTESVEILGTLMVGSTYDGKDFADVFVTSEDYTNFKDAITGNITNILNLIDGTIEAYFQPYSPTLDNEPAATWINEGKLAEHLGDTFTNIQQYDEEDESTYDAGKSWRWTLNEDGTYGWTLISDSDAVAALKKAAEAQDTADGKRRVFVELPKQEQAYDIGDLWVNATYPSDGSIYKDEILRANTAKQAGYPFSIDHWAPASAYKNLYMEALNQAEAARDAADAVSDALTDYKNTVDSAFADGVITAAEATTLLALALTITTTVNDVDLTYNDIYNRGELMDRLEDGTLTESTEKVNLRNAYNAFHGTAENLVDTVNYIVANYVNTTFDKNNLYVIDINIYYALFNDYYKAYIQAINAAQLKITNQIADTKEAQIVDAFAWLNGLFDPDVRALIDGAVIASGIMYVGLPLGGTLYKVNGGFSGINDRDNDIAIWYGGDMIDAETSTDHTDRIAGSLLRYDGSGYFGARWVLDSEGNWNKEYGIRWDKDGIVTVDPATFWVGEAKVDLLLLVFNAIDSEPSDGYTDEVEMLIPFREVRIGSDAYIGYDAVNKSVYVYRLNLDGTREACNFYATGEVTAYGSPYEDESPAYARYVRDLRDVNYGGNVDPDSVDTLLMWNGTTWAYINKNEVGLNEVLLEAYLTENEYAKKSDLITDISWSAITGKPSWITNEKPTYSWIDITNKPTVFTTDIENISGLNSSWDSLLKNKPTSYITRWPSFSEVTNKPTTLSGYGITDGINSVTVKGAGNAITNASISGHTLTLTKGGTYLLSSQYTASDILSKLKTVDGANSGLDADTVDGMQNGYLTAYRLYLVGDVSDFDSLTANGLYRWLTNVTNRPFDYGTVFQFSNLDNPVPGTSQHWVNQLAWATNGRIYARQIVNTGSWTNWNSLAYITDNVASADKLSSSAGSSVTPVYFSNGKPVSCSYSFGNASGNAAINNGTVCSNLNADKLDGFDISNYQTGGWTALTPYLYSSSSGTRWYWYKVAVVPDITGYWQIEVDAHGDNNYPRVANCIIGISVYENGVSKSMNISQMFRLHSVIEACMDTSGNVWIRGLNVEWGCYLRYRITYNSGYGVIRFSNLEKYLANSSGKPSNTSNTIRNGGVKLYSGAFTYYNTNTDVNGSLTDVTKINDNIELSGVRTIIYTPVITASQDSQWRSRSVCIANGSPVSYGINIWNNGDGTGHIQVGRTDSAVTYYNFILQEYGGNVGIGTKSPSLKLHVSGNILATGEVTAYSDERLKSNIEPLVYRGRLNPKSYIKDNKQSIGFIALEVQELYPELVMETGGDNNYLSLNYGNITAVLSAQINIVEDEVTSLKKRVEELENRLSKYEHV